MQQIRLFDERGDRGVERVDYDGFGVLLEILFQLFHRFTNMVAEVLNRRLKLREKGAEAPQRVTALFGALLDGGERVPEVAPVFGRPV